MTKAQYTPRELKRLQLGWALRQQWGSQDTPSETPADRQRRAIERKRDQFRRDQLRDLGFE